MIIEYDRYMVAVHFLTAIEYNDRSGLSTDDEDALDEWLHNQPNGIAHYSYDEHSAFCRDSVTGLMANCIEVVVWVHSSEV